MHDASQLMLLLESFHLRIALAESELNAACKITLLQATGNHPLTYQVVVQERLIG